MSFFFNCPGAVKRLLEWKQGDEDDSWAEKAIESLVKKLRKKKGTLKELELALAKREEGTKCITIERSLDGRLQVSHRKGLPHVIYCRVWRWPDLQTHHELIHVEKCEYAYLKNKDLVCVNPYHYIRVEAPILPPIVVQRNPVPIKKRYIPKPSYLLPLPPLLKPAPQLSCDGNINQQQQPCSSSQVTSLDESNQYLCPCPVGPTCCCPVPELVPDPVIDTTSFAGYLPQAPPAVGATPVYFGIEEAATPFEFNDHQSSSSSHYLEGQQALPVHTAPFYSPTESSSDSSQLSPFYPPNDAPFYPDMQPSLDLQSSPCYSDYQPLIPSFFADTSTISYTDSGTSSPSYYTDYSSPTSQPQSDTSLVDSSPIVISYEQPLVWCSIQYHELTTTIGHAFDASYTSITVDGFMDPTGSDGDRFCLGQLSSVHRNTTIEKTRQFIGRGVQLVLVNGDIFAECLSDCSIFVQSRTSNMENGYHVSTVCKVLPGCSLKVFNNRLFADLLVEASCDSFEAIYKLIHLCSFKISFAKGWGAEYKRQDVTSTPCWVEVSVHGPLKWLDRVLKAMGCPETTCGSDT